MMGANLRCGRAWGACPIADLLLTSAEDGPASNVSYRLRAEMNGLDFDLEEAARNTSAKTPRGWLRLDANLVRSEQHLYLQQPAYGISYLVGKMQIEQIMAARRQQLGEQFTIKRFMDEFDAVGLIPASLVEWELTGEKPTILNRNP